MSVILPYLTVILIWSTTPLAIVWSSETVNPLMAAMFRMAIAAPIALILLKLLRIKLPANSEALKVYAYSSLNVYLGMILTYIAARELASGLISLVYGLAPMITGLLAQKIINEPALSRAKQLALAISFGGLLVVCMDNLTLSENHWVSLVVLILGMVSFSLSAVMVKSVQIALHPLATTTGALWMSLPLYLVSWLLLDGTLPTADWSARSIGAIVYLGTFGSILGFVAYYYVLQKLEAATVGLITLITPVMALMLGAMFNDEALTASVLIGGLGILAGLGLYQFGDRFAKSKSNYQV